MELYINWIAGAGNTHDVFYTNPKIIASYRELTLLCVIVITPSKLHRALCDDHCQPLQKFPQRLRLGNDE